MTAIWVICGVLLFFLLAGLLLLRFVCIRGRIPDMTKPEVQEKYHRTEQQAEILAGVRLVKDGGAEDVFLPSYDGLRLHGRLLQQPQAKGTILLFHGYRSSWESDFSIVLPYYYAQGYNLLIVDERAHGQSEGSYITFGVRERYDVKTWADYAAMHFGADHPLILDGLSMGAAAVLMAAELPLAPSVRGIIADSGFTSPYEVMKSLFCAHCRYLPAAPVLAFVNLFTTVFAGFSLKEASAADAVAKTKLPLLLVHGTGDTFVPHSMSQAVYDACASEKQLVLVEGASHGYSYLVDRPRVQAAIDSFLNKYASMEGFV